MGFDACERGAHCSDRADPVRFHAQAKQSHASQHHTLPPEVTDEIARLDAADLLILQFPM